MLAMSEGIAFGARMGDGSQPEQGMVGKLLGAGKRDHRRFALPHPRHQSRRARAKVSLAAPYPGKIVPVHLGESATA